jgi:hypothetical protein
MYMDKLTKSSVRGRNRKLYGILPAVFLVGGCLDQVDDKSSADQQEPVGSTEQAFTANWSYSWGVVNNSSIDIGTSSGRTCFLTGVTGNIQPAIWPEAGNDQTGVGLSIDPGTGDYHLNVTPIDGGWGLPLQAFARCVNTAAGRTNEVTWTSQLNGSQPQYMGAVTSNRRCFLTSITTSSEYPNGAFQGSGGFRSNSDNVRVSNDGFSWWIGGSQPANSMVWAKGRCIDVTYDVGGWEWIAGDPGVRQDLLTNQAPISGVGAATCFLTGIGGHLTANDWADGAYISQSTSAANPNQFYMNTKNGKTGWANCVM